MTAGPAITRLPRLVAALGPADRELFERLFHVTVSEGRLRAPESMRGWLRERFGGVRTVERQTVVRVANRWTLEEAVFNRLRARRPKAPPPPPRRRERTDDPFSRPRELTPEDEFGRVEGEHCLTAANVAKVEGWHSLIIFREPDPMAFTAESLADCLETARRWWETAREHDPDAVYPLLFWNCGPTAGASLGHAHVQLVLARGRPFGGVERLRAAAEAYRAAWGSDYFRDLIRVHAALGLLFTHEGSAVFASLVPAKERETFIVAPSLEEGLAGALYRVLACYRDRLSVRAFNVAFIRPPLGPAAGDWERFPFLVRVVERPAPPPSTSDIGAMEMFAAPVVSSDPFDLARALAGTPEAAS